MKQKSFKSSPFSRLVSFSKTVAVAGGHLAAERLERRLNNINKKKEELDQLKHKVQQNQLEHL